MYTEGTDHALLINSLKVGASETGEGTQETGFARNSLELKIETGKSYRSQVSAHGGSSTPHPIGLLNTKILDFAKDL